MSSTAVSTSACPTLSPHTSKSSKHVAFCALQIFEFGLRADASKVPVEGEYAIGIQQTPHSYYYVTNIDAYETKRNAERLENGPDPISADKRREIWEREEEEAIQSALHKQRVDDCESEEDAEIILRPAHTQLHSHSAQDLDVTVDSIAPSDEVNSAAHVSEMEVDSPSSACFKFFPVSSLPPLSLHSTSFTAPAFFSDVEHVQKIRSSREQAGCHCCVRGKKSACHVANESANGSAVHTLRSSAAPVQECPCALSGVGCNSNICNCTSATCHNPNPRYLFNQRKVNQQRRKLLKQLDGHSEDTANTQSTHSCA